MPDIHRRPGGPTTADIVRADVAEELHEIAEGLEVADLYPGLVYRLRLLAAKLDGTRVL